MKCPKCGFVSYPGIPQCKKCGYVFSPVKSKGSPAQILGLFTSPDPTATENMLSQPAHREQPPPVLPDPPAHVSEMAVQPSPAAKPTSIPVGIAAPPADSARPLHEELSHRVEDFRRRRARLKGQSDSEANLEFDFPGERGTADEPALDSRPVEFIDPGADFDVILDKPDTANPGNAAIDSLSLDRPGGFGTLDSDSFPAADSSFEADSAPARPVEIVIDSQPSVEDARETSESMRLPLAPLSRRFVGGMVDALVLVVAAALFALIFWRAGGRLSPLPLNFAVVAFIAVAFIMGYFGIFTALTFTTPGLLWMGIEVRGLRGGVPTPQQAFWRALGYVVSISALLLGFVWALVDSDGLTWHDRMSDTFLTDAESAVQS